MAKTKQPNYQDPAFLTWAKNHNWYGYGPTNKLNPMLAKSKNPEIVTDGTGEWVHKGPGHSTHLSTAELYKMYEASTGLLGAKIQYAQALEQAKTAAEATPIITRSQEEADKAAAKVAEKKKSVLAKKAAPKKKKVIPKKK